MTEHQKDRDQMDGDDKGRDQVVDLDALFASARQTPVELGAPLQSRILADAADEQARWQQPAPPPRRAKRSPVAQLLAALGGWPSVGGLIAASCTGLWVGLAAPEAMLGTSGLSLFGSAATAVSGEDYAAYETFDLATVLAEDMQ